LNVSPRQKLVTYVARNLEPYRGFHTFMRALPAILDARPEVVVSVVGGDDVSYGAPHPKGPWRQVLLQELEGKLDLSRVHFLGKIPYPQHISLLQRSDAHVYLSYPFVASWSLREAMAVGCVVVGSDTRTVTEFVTDRETGLVVPALKPESVSAAVLEALSDAKLAASLRKNARAYAEKHLDLQDYLRRYRLVIEEITGQSLLAPPAMEAGKPPARERAKTRAKPPAKSPRRSSAKPPAKTPPKPPVKTPARIAPGTQGRARTRNAA
jgi:glycosyltransferase involved in cell wall biosynthesis